MDTMHIAWLVAAAVVFGFAAIVSLVFPRAPELKAAGDGKQLPAVRPLRHHRSVVAMRGRHACSVKRVPGSARSGQTADAAT
jgi:hypothetical protein